MNQILGDDFCQLELLASILENFEERGLERVQLHAFQKHGEQTAVAPEGHLRVPELLWAVREALTLATKYSVLVDFMKSTGHVGLPKL